MITGICGLAIKSIDLNMVDNNQSNLNHITIMTFTNQEEDTSTIPTPEEEEKEEEEEEESEE